jgi:alcohol dehydrogenase
MEHAMSAFHPKLPHGAGLIMISEAYYAHFAQSGACDQRMIAMAKAMGLADAKSPLDFVTQLVKLQKDCSVYGLKMSDYGIVPGEFTRLMKNARSAMGGLFANDPALLSDEEVIKIFENSYR